MERPTVICHMCTSLDGKISGDFMDAPGAQEALGAYGELRSFYDCQATVYGTTTMLGGYADGVVILKEHVAPLHHEDFVTTAAKEAEQLIFALDPEGKLGYTSSVIEKKGRAPATVVEVLTENVPDAYLRYLQGLGASYLFCGTRTIDVRVLLQKMASKLGVERLMLAGGGVTNAYFLAAGCIDELSIVVAPVTSGQAHGLSIFEGEGDMVADFSLQEMQKLAGDALWLRYIRAGV